MATHQHGTYPDHIMTRERRLCALFGARVARALGGDGSIDVKPIELHPNARFTAERRYLAKDDDGNVKETVVQLFGRVAAKLAVQHIMYSIDAEPSEPGSTLKTDKQIVEETFERFAGYYETLRTFRFVPGGRTLANETTSVPNCIVLHPHDSLDNIFKVLHEAALLQKAGSGLGFPLHLMRPTGMKTRAVAGEASGPVSFLHVYNSAFGVIKQQNRNGASCVREAR
jgi:ribonucleoside-diphosphate reductase alpha chain